MAYASNSVLLTIAFFEGSAAFILLVIYSLLINNFPGQFFRYWLAGWTFFFTLQAATIVFFFQRSGDNAVVRYPLSLAMAGLFLAAAFDCTGKTGRLKYLVPWAVIAGTGLIGLEVARLSMVAEWGASLLESALLLAAGWILWRSQFRHRGFGWKLLAGALLLGGLHGLDRPEWPLQSLAWVRVSLQGLFVITAGIAMAVLVLEATRSRNEDLNERLRRLSLITAEATQSFRVDKALDGILRHLVESLNASHGIVFLLDESATERALALRASVGFSERYVTQYARIPEREPWVREALQEARRFVSGSVGENACLQGWFGAEKVASGILVVVPGKEAPLGVLAIGRAALRKFEGDEENFLINVVNLLGLTLQNVALFESAAVSRRQWRDTFDSIDDLIFVHATDGRILRTNRAFANRVRVEPVNLVDKQVRDVLTRGASQWMRCPYCEGVAGKAEEIDPSFGGYFLVTTSTLHGSEGGKLGTIHVLKDFTSSRLAENKFRNLFEKAQEGVFIVTPEGRLLDCNDALTRLYGFESREELIRVYTPEGFYVDMEDQHRWAALLEKYGELTDFEFQFRRRDGEIRTVHLSAFVTRDETGAVAAYQGFLLDITERKRAEVEIRRRNQELLALNAIGDLLRQAATLEQGLTDSLQKVGELFAADFGAVYLLDEPSNTLRLSAAVGGKSAQGRHAPPFKVPDSLLAQIRQAHATMLPGTAQALPEDIRTLREEEGIASSQVAVLWAKDRIMGMLLLGCRQIREFSAAELNLLAAIGNQMAITIDKSLLLEETQEAYESLRQTQEQLLQSEKMAAVGQLVAGVAHELNNPLTAILGYSQLLQSQEFTNPRGEDYLRKLFKQAQRTHHIVQNLLSFARQHKPERTAVDLNQILEDTLLLREYDLNSAKIDVQREFDRSLPATGGDFHQLQQVFLNILNNAMDAVAENPGRGEIRIRTGKEGERLRVEFTNNGPPVENPNRIFDPFYTTKPVGKGTGLGLSICYGIVKEHGGEIQVRNSDQGVTFSILLPVVTPSHATAAEPSSERMDNAAGKVLVLEGEEAVLQLEKEVLESRGLLVRTARSAWEAIDILKKEMVDAAVLDAQIPGETSTPALYRWIEQNRPELATRVIFAASSGRDPVVAELPEKSGCHLLTKPFAVQEFWESIQKVLAWNAPESLRR